MSYEENEEGSIIEEIERKIHELSRKDIDVYKFRAVALAENLIESLKHSKKTERLNDFELGKIEILRNMLVHGCNFNLEKTKGSIEDYNTKQSLQNFYTLVKDTSEKEKIYLLNSILLKNKNYLPKNDSLEDFSFNVDKLTSFFNKIRESEANDFYEFREQNRKKLEKIKTSQKGLLSKLETKQIDQNIFEKEKKKLEELQQKIQEDISTANWLCHISIGKNIQELENNTKNTSDLVLEKNKTLLETLKKPARDIDAYIKSTKSKQLKKQRGRQ